MAFSFETKITSLLLLLCLLMTHISCSQDHHGCTDQQAENYNYEATLNDGSCQYQETHYNLTFVHELSAKIKETSNLIVWKNSLWTTNDSGNKASLYQLDTLTGAVLKEFPLRGVENNDWEALAQSDDAIFIGDFGNNLGNRTDLRILKIKKEEIQPNTDSLSAEIISFHYPEQTDFTPDNLNTEWDAEAFYFAQDSLYIFTKDWKNNSTTIYSLPSEKGEYAAQKRYEFNSDGLITDASYNEETNALILVGYKLAGLSGFDGFCWILWDFPHHEIMNGNKRRIELGSTFDIGQIEGVTWTGKHNGFISSEAINSNTFDIHLPPMLHQFDFSDFLDNKNTSNTTENTLFEFTVFPQPAHDTFEMSFPKATENVTIYSINGKVKWKETISTPATTISISCAEWEPGIYFIRAEGYPIKRIQIN